MFSPLYWLPLPHFHTFQYVEMRLEGEEDKNESLGIVV